MDSTSVYGLELLLLEGTGGKALATDHRVWRLRIFLWALLAERGFILLVHWFDWYDWYEWNIIHSIGIALVNCILLWGLRRISKNTFSVFGLARFRNEEYTLYLACV